MKLSSKLVKKQAPLEYVIYSVIILVGIFLDQLTKLLTANLMDLYESIPIIKDVIHITYVQNTGAAFGMMKDSRWLFMIVSTVMIIGLSLYLYLGHAESRLYGISIAMIVSGGIGNMIDRIALGYVVDMIDFTLIDFAVFNGADSFVCVGAGLLILALILDIIKESKEKKTGESK
jgi:signal peptidase II